MTPFISCLVKLANGTFFICILLRFAILYNEFINETYCETNCMPDIFHWALKEAIWLSD